MLSRDIDEFEKDKLLIFGLMVGQMSNNSKNRIKDIDIGLIAMTDQDRRLLLSAILATHLIDNRLG